MKVKGYSLLEIILVTSFIIIFIVVINPGTYIDRFSKMLLKINVLNESELLVAKLNSFAYDDCDIQGSSSVGIDFLHGQDVLSLRFDSNQLIIQNLGTNAEAVLYRHVSPTSLTGFNFIILIFLLRFQIFVLLIFYLNHHCLTMMLLDQLFVEIIKLY